MSEITPTWEEFDRTGASKTDMKAYVSLQRRGSFTINRSAYEAMGKPEAMRLLYDRDHQIIGFRPVKIGERAAYRVNKHFSADTYSVAAQAFTNYYGIDISETRRYELKQYGDVQGIDLNEPDARPQRVKRAS